ncbi:MAG: shikimate dehydrogenase family protein, partial [Anaerolineae bacterium]
MNNINASTRLTGIIGWPVEHSLSPVMHNAAFEALGLNWCYAAFPVPPELLGDAVQGLRALGIAGANVTIPHKEAVIPFLDVLSPAARAVGAVNTISVDGEYLLGDNTDVHGFLAALDRADVPLHGRRALVLGAGGSARAAVYGLLLRGAEVII